MDMKNIVEEILEEFGNKYQSFELGEPVNIDQFKKLDEFLRKSLTQALSQSKKDVIEMVRSEVLVNTANGNDGSEYSNGFYKAMDFVDKKLLSLKDKED